MDMECNLSKIRMVVFLSRSKFIKIFPVPCKPHSAACDSEAYDASNKSHWECEACDQGAEGRLVLSHFSSAKTSSNISTCL